MSHDPIDAAQMAASTAREVLARARMARQHALDALVAACAVETSAIAALEEAESRLEEATLAFGS